jgi:leukotriene-A4 hydrolase
MKTDNLMTRPTDLDSQDRYSHSEPDQIRVKHLDLDLDVLFDERILRGTALLTLDRRFSGDLVLDTRNLVIHSAEYSADGRDFREARFELKHYNPILGAALTIHLPQESVAVRIRYSTVPDASGLQWLEAPQTASKQYPFLYTQSEATHARSWIPLQDTPRVRSTYSARIRKPANLRALMSACNNPAAYRDTDVNFSMPYPIPSYLFALAVGDLDRRELSERTGVFSERPVIERAARELEDLENMVRATEELFGPYRWNRFDVLILPPSFPIGGMENPCLTFTTPTILAGDKSLTSLIVHELAHSWSSNLVSHATWRHVWLNEGVTVYMERRIVERLYGRRRAEMEAVLGLQELEKVFAKVQPGDQVLAELSGRDPNAGFSEVPYQKGALFLRTIEESFGRPRFDVFLRGYLEHFAFQSITTSQFVDYLEANLLSHDAKAAGQISIDDWLHAPGLPDGAALPVSDALAIVEERAVRWLRGELSPKDLGTEQWSTQEWLHFLACVDPQIDAEKMAKLDAEFHITDSGNAEIENQWLLMVIRNKYERAFPRLEEFLTSVGRRKFLKSLYGALANTPEGKRWALAIYERAYPSYHPITRSAIQDILRREP